MPGGNLALAFGAILAGAVAIDYGVKNAHASITSAGASTPTSQDVTPSSGVSATVVPGTKGNVVTPDAAWNPMRKPIASWIVPVLDWASTHGWTGSVTSGYRTYSQQASINASGAYSAPAGQSNHEGAVYPLGAVDVTNPSQLLQVLKGYNGPHKLIGGVLGAIDPEHFSATGH